MLKIKIAFATCLVIGALAIVFNLDFSAESAYTQVEPTIVYVYLSAPAQTTIVEANTYYPVGGVFVNNPICGWTFVTDRIQYDLTTTRWFEINWAVLISTDSPLTTVHVAVKHNNIVRDLQGMGTRCFIAGDIYSFSGIDVIRIAQNDTIQLVVTSNGDGDVITFDRFTALITNVIG